jgi:hypothetical protein
MEDVNYEGAIADVDDATVGRSRACTAPGVVVLGVRVGLQQIHGNDRALGAALADICPSQSGTAVA